jgi:hypothetical protein
LEYLGVCGNLGDGGEGGHFSVNWEKAKTIRNIRGVTKYRAHASRIPSLFTLKYIKITFISLNATTNK